MAIISYDAASLTLTVGLVGDLLPSKTSRAAAPAYKVGTRAIVRSPGTSDHGRVFVVSRDALGGHEWLEQTSPFDLFLDERYRDLVGARFVESDEESSTTMRTMQTKLELVVPDLPPGTYAVIFSAELAGSIGGRIVEAQMVVDGTPVAKHGGRWPQNDWYMPLFNLARPVFAEKSSRTFSIQYRCGQGSQTAKIRRGRILAWRVS